MRRSLRCEVLIDGEAQGPLLVLQEPISFWGGVEPGSGMIVESRHPQAGRSVAGTVLVLTHGRGSSSASSVLAEMIRLGTSPAALVMSDADPILILGAVVAQELYGRTTPILVTAEAAGGWAVDGADGRVRRGGWLEVE